MGEPIYLSSYLTNVYHIGMIDLQYVYATYMWYTSLYEMIYSKIV